MHHCMILLFNPYDVIAAVPVLPASSSCRHFTPLVWRAAGTSLSSGAALHHGADGRRDSLSSNESRFITGTGCYDSLRCQCQVEKTSIREAMNLLHHRRDSNTEGTCFRDIKDLCFAREIQSGNLEAWKDVSKERS